MLSEWSAECGPDDPVLVVPWSDPAHPEIHFIDLRENPYDLDHLPEAEQHPTLLQVLRALNAPRSPVFTAKCDAWTVAATNADDTYAQSELAYLHLHLQQGAEETPVAFASYIDLLWRDRTVFASLHRHEQLLDRLTRRAVPLDHPYAMLELVLRPALVDLAGAQEGFAVSLYIKALGYGPESANQNWSRAFNDVVALLRNKAFAS
ncbi:hypothetical protein [Edaphobacter bradus]|uniref:hypothetical protein n=1 Tax=Edaphobacter bradus TaxID=2259016 RepID=UPI0021E0E8C7|nr:hypothetical protein [Edaphobacter bradus]